MPVGRALFAAALLLSTSCASLASLSSMGGRRSYVYVAPFVDETPGMELGFLVTQVVQETLYRRAPDRFLVVFDDAACAVDGTVVAVRDEDAGDGARDVVVGVSAVVVDKAGRVRHSTGVHERRARYALADTAAETEQRRARAKSIAAATAGRALVDDLLRMP